MLPILIENKNLSPPLLAGFVDEGLVNVRNDTSASDCGLDECIQFFVTTNGKLQVARSNTLNFQIFGCISCQLKNFGSQVFKNSGSVHSSGGTNTLSLRNPSLEVSVDTADRKLHITNLQAISLIRAQW